MKLILFIILVLFIFNFFNEISGQVGDSPFERKFGEIKFLDAYFGTAQEKIEVSPGDENVPFTVVMANVGTQDITGIRGQLSMPMGFSSSDGLNSPIVADFDSNALAGEVFSLTFFVNLDDKLHIKSYPGTVKVDYSRLRESGLRNAFFDFNFKITGDSVINVRALNPFLTSLKTNQVVIEIYNDGTAPISAVDIQATNTQTAISSTTQSVTNVEKVVILETNWDVGHIPPHSSKQLIGYVYVPESIKDETLRIPLEITYFNAHGDQKTINRIVDFYIKGFIDPRIYNVQVIDLSGIPTIIGEIINEGNEDALFGFVTVEGIGNSNIKKTTQFIDEIEVDSPVPFNIPIEFIGDPKYGNHDIQITARYKDSVRDENFIVYNTTISIPNNLENKQNEINFIPFVILSITAAVGIFIYKKQKYTIIPKSRK